MRSEAAMRKTLKRLRKIWKRRPELPLSELLRGDGLDGSYSNDRDYLEMLSSWWKRVKK